MSVKLKQLTVRGLKSIRELTDFEPQPLNILVGANGAGKSNFISFFRMLSWMTAPGGRLQEYVGLFGRANSMLHEGADVTPHLDARLRLETESGSNDYRFRLSHAQGDIFVFVDEEYRFSRFGFPSEAPWVQLGAGHREAKLVEAAERGDRTARTILALLRLCVVYQFHNTSMTARIRQSWRVADNRWLKEDAANLGPFLLRLREGRPQYYRRIVETIRLLLPFFADFELEPQNGSLMLKWHERGSDMVFDASQAADGMLRAMALAALLGQPEEDLPGLLILDEPELGLHPYAVHVIAGMLRSASRHCQVFLATQSPTLVDQFEPQDIVVVDRAGRESTFRRLDAEELRDWLKEYSLAELWEKNVLGGRPAR